MNHPTQLVLESLAHRDYISLFVATWRPMDSWRDKYSVTVSPLSTVGPIFIRDNRTVMVVLNSDVNYNITLSKCNENIKFKGKFCFYFMLHNVTMNYIEMISLFLREMSIYFENFFIQRRSIHH